jgi:hypothetical protein
LRDRKNLSGNTVFPDLSPSSIPHNKPIKQNELLTQQKSFISTTFYHVLKSTSVLLYMYNYTQHYTYN